MNTARPNSLTTPGITTAKPSTSTVKPTTPGNATVSKPTPGAGNTNSGKPISPVQNRYALSPATNAALLPVVSKVEPNTGVALQKVLKGQLLTRDDRDLLWGAFLNNPSLSTPERAAISSALQNDLDEKRKLAVLPGPSIIPSPSVIPSPVVPQFPVQPPLVIQPPVPVQPTFPVQPPTNPVVVEPPTVTQDPVHQVRTLTLENQTGEELTVYVRMPGAAEPVQYTFPANAVSTLMVSDTEYLMANHLRVWAETASGSRYTQYRDADLVLVPEPYQAPSVGNFTYTFSK